MAKSGSDSGGVKDVSVPSVCSAASYLNTH